MLCLVDALDYEIKLSSCHFKYVWYHGEHQKLDVVGAVMWHPETPIYPLGRQSWNVRWICVGVRSSHRHVAGPGLGCVVLCPYLTWYLMRSGWTAVVGVARRGRKYDFFSLGGWIWPCLRVKALRGWYMPSIAKVGPGGGGLLLLSNQLLDKVSIAGQCWPGLKCLLLEIKILTILPVYHHLPFSFTPCWIHRVLITCSYAGHSHRHTVSHRIQVHRLLLPKLVGARSVFSFHSFTVTKDRPIHNEGGNCLPSYLHLMGNGEQSGLLQHIFRQRAHPGSIRFLVRFILGGHPPCRMGDRFLS